MSHRGTEPRLVVDAGIQYNRGHLRGMQGAGERVFGEFSGVVRSGDSIYNRHVAGE